MPTHIEELAKAQAEQFAKILCPQRHHVWFREQGSAYCPECKETFPYSKLIDLNKSCF